MWLICLFIILACVFILTDPQLRMVISFLLVALINKKKIDKIPGPPGYPIVGNFFDVSKNVDRSWEYSRELNQKYYPIFKLTNFGFPAVCLQDPDDIEILLTSTSQIDKGSVYGGLHYWLGSGLLLSTGKKWQSRRKILTPAFHFNILKQFSGIFFEQSDILMRKIEEECDKPYTDIVPLVTEFALDSITETAMGSNKLYSKEKREHYSEAINSMAEILVYRAARPWYFVDKLYHLTPCYKDEVKRVTFLHKFTNEVIEYRKKNFCMDDMFNVSSNDDIHEKKRFAMLDLLLHVKNKGEEIDDQSIREEVDTFMFEGHHTTTSAISFTLMALACNPDIQDKVVREIEVVIGNRKPTFTDLHNMKYLELVLKESLRMYPSVPMISRVTSKEMQTKTGYTIPPCTNVFIFIYDLHHNPRFYPEPYKFNPDRFLLENSKNRHPFSYIPFSAGPRNCIGQKFALLEIKTVIVSILKKYVIKPVNKFEDLHFDIDFVMRATNGIKVKFERRNPI